MSKYKEYQSAYIKCPNCGGFIDQDSMLCRKYGYDMEKEKINGGFSGTKNTSKEKRYR